MSDPTQQASTAEMKRHRDDIDKIKQGSSLSNLSGSAPTDNGIPKLDEMCRQYNDGEINLNELVCRAWNGGFAEGADTKY